MVATRKLTGFCSATLQVFDVKQALSNPQAPLLPMTPGFKIKKLLGK